MTGSTTSAAHFGRSMLDSWLLESNCTYLNHGTVGATPRRVLHAQQSLQREIERHPSRFLLRELVPLVGGPRSDEPRIRVAAREVAGFFNARADDLVFVDNTTTAINAVLRSFDFRPGDEIVLLDHAYGAIRHAADYAARTTGAVVRVVSLPLLTTATIRRNLRILGDRQASGRELARAFGIT